MGKFQVDCERASGVPFAVEKLLVNNPERFQLA